VSKLEAQVVELQAVAHGVDQDNASKAALAGSPVRKLEALTIRTEVYSMLGMHESLRPD